jgi:hypothetical protein
MGCELYSRLSSRNLLALILALGENKAQGTQAQIKVHQLIVRYTNHVKKEKATK